MNFNNITGVVLEKLSQKSISEKCKIWNHDHAPQFQIGEKSTFPKL